MELGVANTEMAEAIDTIGSGIDALFTAGLKPVNSRDAITCIRQIEVLRRRIDAAAVELQTEIDDACFHGADGHGSAKIMVRTYAKLSNDEAAARDKTRKVLAALPEVAAAYRAGHIGTDQVRVLGRVHANPRVRDKMRDDQSWFLHRAKRLNCSQFAIKAIEWMNLIDEDGPEPKAQIDHERRNVSLTQDFDKSWALIGSFAPAQGAQLDEIFGHYIEAETLTDWEKARAEHGDTATDSDLPRTVQQRRSDAMWQLFQDAAACPTGAVPPGFTHNVVWGSETFEEMGRRVATGQMEPLDPDVFRCETIDGIQLDPYESFANALNSRIRRVLIDQKSTVIDLGEARFFTGLARHAVKLGFTECVWVGCHVPSSKCEADHLVEHSRRGRTNPSNGAPLCGKHNRWKQKGFSIHRDQAGYWHTYRPDGTEVPAG